MPVALHPAPSSLLNRGEDSGMNLGHLSSTTNSANSGETESHQGQRCRFWDLLMFLWPFVHPHISPLAAHQNQGQNCQRQSTNIFCHSNYSLSMTWPAGL